MQYFWKHVLKTKSISTVNPKYIMGFDHAKSCIGRYEKTLYRKDSETYYLNSG